MSGAPRIFLIDGYSTLFRAYYAIRNLSSSKGEPTNAVWGFLLVLRKLLREESPEYVAVAFDAGRDERVALLEEYKANRRPTPEDFKSQIPWVRKILEAYRIPILEVEGQEADDVLGTLARRARMEGWRVVLVSADKDLFQLVGDGVTMLHSGRDKVYDEAGVEEDFGVPPERVVDVLALMGDSVDNVPGVPGIGAKGAVKLVQEMGTLEAILERAEEVKRKSYREGLLENRDQAMLSKDLVTIRTDLPVQFSPEALRRSEPDWDRLLELAWELDFQSLARELEEEHGAGGEDIDAATELSSAEEWSAWLEESGGTWFVAPVGPGEDEVEGLAFARGESEVHWLDFRTEGLREIVIRGLAEELGDEGVDVVGHDLKSILRAFPEIGSSCRARLTDTMLLSYLLVPSLRSHELPDLALERLRHRVAEPKEVGWSGGSRPPVGAESLRVFAAEQVELPRRMAPTLEKELDAAGLRGVYEELERPLVPVLAAMERTGIELDTAFLAELGDEMGDRVDALEDAIFDEVGESFNLASSQQLGEILFERLGFPVVKRTRKTRSYSTSAEVLQELDAKGFTLAGKILEHRELTKLRSNWIEGLPALVGPDGRLHTHYQQAVAATGRLSSARPNLQNIPVRSGVGSEIRRAFRAAEGWSLVVADYSQIELRVLAHVSGDAAMIEAFRTGEDIHAATAAVVFGGLPELVTSEQRRAAKVINFGILYGMTPWGLSKQLGITPGEAKRFIAAYLDRFEGVRRYTEETLERARATSRVETLWGRIRWLPDIRSRNRMVRENTERMAVNAPIQGSAADILKLAMIRLHGRLAEAGTGARLLLTVHDELVVEAPQGTEDETVGVVRDVMSSVVELEVPLDVDAGVGPDWGSAKA